MEPTRIKVKKKLSISDLLPLKMLFLVGYGLLIWILLYMYTGTKQFINWVVAVQSQVSFGDESSWIIHRKGPERLDFEYSIFVFILMWLELGAFGKDYWCMFVKELLYIHMFPSSVFWESLETMEELPVVKISVRILVSNYFPINWTRAS